LATAELDERVLARGDENRSAGLTTAGAAEPDEPPKVAECRSALTPPLERNRV
jgi:hypothetical protein